jgi:Large polyvalent protein associated domain 38
MLKTDPLSFLDEEPVETGKSFVKPANRRIRQSYEEDPLSFLDETSEKEQIAESASEQPSFSNKASVLFSNESESDPLSFLSSEKVSSKEAPQSKESPENILDYYRTEDKSPEELKSMSLDERMQYMENLKTEREFRQSRGFTKGALSGLTLGASEHIPGLKPNEEDLLVGLGETVGSYLPISKLYNFIGKPIVNLAAKSPIARQGLEALARMTGFGLTGAAYKGTKELVQGEVPDPAELAKEGAIWAGIDAVLQGLGLGIAFQQSIGRIAEAEGMTAKEVLGRLWDATKNYVKAKFGRSIEGEVLTEDVEVLLQEAKKAEAAIKPKETEIDVTPTEEKIAKPEIISDEQIDADLAKAKNELAELEETQGKGATQERSALIQEINALELEKHNRAKEVSKAKAVEPETAGVTFTTSKGSTYTINPDGTTTRVKAARPEHPGEKGLQPTSEKTWYVSPEDANKLSEFQAQGGPDKRIIELPDGRLGIMYENGKHAGNVESRTVVTPLSEPAEGLIPVESWKGGRKIHFGNEITKVERAQPKPEAHKPEAIEAFQPIEAEPVERDQPEVSAIDERPILKGIMDLKEELSKTKGTTRAIQQKKQELSDQIKEKVKELAEARKHNKALEKPILKKAGRPDITPKGLKQQKNYIIDKIDDAIENPPDTNQIVIDVPDDGTFKINNEPRILESVRNKVEKEWPIKPLSNKPPAGIKLKVGKEEGAEVLKSELPEAEVESGEELPKKATQIPPRQTRPKQPVVGKKQAVARSKIIELFRKAFTDPIRLGKISKRKAAGIHKLWPKVTRLLKDNDVETAAHEIGHNLHTTLYGGDAKTPTEQAHNISNALRPYLDELKPLAHYEPWGMEGFAEFTRLYVTNPYVALELAPKFYAKFENDLRAEYPEMLNALLEAREYYDAYLQGTPQSRIRAQTSYAQDKGKLANIIDSVKKYLDPDYLKTQFLDDVFPAKRLVAEAFGIPLSEVENLKDERNLYRALRVLKGAVGKGDVFVLHETFNAKTLDKINGSLRDILKQLPNEEAYREFNDYLIARRALEKTAQNIETGINAGDALAVELELRPKYGELARELDKYNDALLQYAKDAGLLSEKQYLMIKQNNVLYTPFQRVMESEKGGIAAGGGRIQAGKPIKRMKGSTRDIIAPVESILKNTYSIIINAEKNLAGKVLANLAKTKSDLGAYVELVPTPIKLKAKLEGEQVAKELAKRFEDEGLEDLIEYDDKGKPVLREDIADAIPDVFLKFGAGQYPARENIVTVYFDGKPVYYQVSPELFEMWNKGIAPYSAGLLTKILRIPARTLRAGAILNPKFMMKNIVRDTWGSWLFTKYGKSVKDPVNLFIDTLYSPLAMLATSAGKGGLYVEWMKSGGSMSTMQSLDRDNIVKKLDEVRHGWKSNGVIKWLRQVAEWSEEANRLSEFGKALAVEGKTRLGREIAAFAARDLSIDFAKIGLQVKVLNQIIPFFNATVQGGDKLLRTFANAEDRKHFLPRIFGFIVLPSLMLAWLNKDDENVQEFYEEEKDFNFITQINGQYVKIPVPFETGVIAHGLTQRMFNYFMKKDPEAFEKFMGSIMDAMLPSFIPTIGLPFFETWANKNFFTGGRIIPRAQEDLIAKYQYKNNTSSTSRLLGRAMTYMLGQETRLKAASPAVIDHFINAWGAGLGQLMIKISDASLESLGLSDKIQGPDQAITEKYGLDAFTTRFPRASTRSIEKFYDNYADATARKKSFKHAEKMELATEEEQEAAYQRFEKIYDYSTLQKAYKAMQACQKEINNIWNDPSIEADLKKQMIDDLYLQQIEFAKAANEDIRQYRLAQED